MAFSSSSVFNSGITDSSFFSLSIIVNWDNKVEGVVGLGRRLELPDPGLGGKLELLDLEGDEHAPVLKCKMGFTISSFGFMDFLLSWSFEVVLFVVETFAAASPTFAAALASEGPVKRCTTSLNASEFV